MDYPKVISIQDPMIVRVSPTILAVNGTTFTAKIKEGIQHRGFNIYASSIGYPIYIHSVSDKEASGYSIEGDDLKNYITDLASKWLDDLQNSFVESQDLSMTQLLQALLYQLHYDISGAVPTDIPDKIRAILDFSSKPIKEMIEDVSESIDVVAETIDTVSEKLNTIDTTLQTIGNKIDTSIGDVKTSIDSVETAIEAVSDTLADEETGLPMIASSISDINTSMQTLDTHTNTSLMAIVNKLADSDKTLGKQIEDSVSNAMAHMDGRFDDIDTAVSTVNTNVQTVNTNVQSVNTTALAISTAIGTVPSTTSLYSEIEHIKGFETNINQTKATSDTILSTCIAIQNAVGSGASGASVAEVKAAVDAIGVYFPATYENTNNIYYAVDSIKNSVNHLGNADSSVSMITGANRTYYLKDNNLYTSSMSDALSNWSEAMFGANGAFYFDGQQWKVRS